MAFFFDRLPCPRPSGLESIWFSTFEMSLNSLISTSGNTDCLAPCNHFCTSAGISENTSHSLLSHCCARRAEGRISYFKVLTSCGRSLNFKKRRRRLRSNSIGWKWRILYWRRVQRNAGVCLCKPIQCRYIVDQPFLLTLVIRNHGYSA